MRHSGSWRWVSQYSLLAPNPSTLLTFLLADLAFPARHPARALLVLFSSVHPPTTSPLCFCHGTGAEQAPQHRRRSSVPLSAPRQLARLGSPQKQKPGRPPDPASVADALRHALA